MLQVRNQNNSSAE